MVSPVYWSAGVNSSCIAWYSQCVP